MQPKCRNRRIQWMLLFLWGSAGGLWAEPLPTPLSEINRILFFAGGRPPTVQPLSAQLPADVDWSFRATDSALQSEISWEQKNRFRFSAVMALPLSSLSPAETQRAAARVAPPRAAFSDSVNKEGLPLRFDSFFLQPMLHIHFPQIHLTVDLKGKLAPVFNLIASDKSETDFHNQFDYQIQINWLDFVFPKKRKYRNSLYLKGNISQKSVYADFSEQRLTNQSSVRFGNCYEKGSALQVTAGVWLFNEEKIDLTLPHPADENFSGLHLDLAVEYQWEQAAINLSFTPTIDRKGRLLDFENPILALSTLCHLNSDL